MNRIVNIIIGFGNTITNIFRANFEINIKWFETILKNNYDEEIEIKYHIELHQNTKFEDVHLLDILKFEQFKKVFCDELNFLETDISFFKESFESLNSYLKSENINYIENPLEKNKKFKDYPEKLFDNINNVLKNKEIIFDIFDCENYSFLDKLCLIQKFDTFELFDINYSIEDWVSFLDKEPNHFEFYKNYRLYNSVLRSINEFNIKIINYKNNFNHKIIAGPAGTGKSHYLAYLVEKVKDTGDLSIFLKPKSFSGDNINFNEKLLELLEIPKGYTLPEILEKLNSFSKINNKRCFIFIDALNETTKNNIGFSTIWKINLQSFINQIKSYPYLYIVCSLRTSYVEMIWDYKPKNLVEIKGFENDKITKAACNKYFDYYKINPSNLDYADITIFRTPLLLDLYCKLINPKRNETVEITIDLETYLKIFQDYIDVLVVNEVKNKLNYASSRPIKEGFYKSSSFYYDKNQDSLNIDDFVDAFDMDPKVSIDNSISKAVLGYLIFVKEFINNKEFVKHTYQEVGGFLLATKLSQDFTNIYELVNSKDFNDKVIGTNITTHHQLRLDILKFLIALRPEIIELLSDSDSIKLSWWQLFNSRTNLTEVELQSNLRESLKTDSIFDNLLEVSSNNWFNSDIKLNFNFISKIINDYNLWDFELKWTYFIYRKADELDSFIDESIYELDNQSKIILEKEIIIAKFISHILSTTVRELRDKATLYIINFGKLYPLELLELTIEASQYKDIYIYERLTSCCYGVLLIRQNDKEYLEYFLPRIADELFKLQFSENPTAPKYNYIVIDSIKHLIDFAILNDLISLTKQQKLKISNYEFTPPNDWIPPSEEQVNLINESHETSWPDPIGMDFGIYTIPRLIKKDDVDYNRRFAIANVYKRIFELGYENLDLSNFNNELFKEFIWGYDIYGIKGKVDKLEKKYCWIAFFDFAGYLLMKKALNVFDKNGTGINNYQRLGDVDIDISLPNKDYDERLKLYHFDLLGRKEIDSKWYEENKIDTIKDLFETNLGTDDFTMLYGFVDQRVSDDYKVRSFLMVETMFIDKNENLKKLKKESDVFEWSSDIYISRDHNRNSYFGELYWADNMNIYDKDVIYIPTNDKIRNHRNKTLENILIDKNHRREIPEEDIDEIRYKTVQFKSEPTLIDYLWESNSKLLTGFGEYFPSVRLGKFLNLKADPKSGKILDKNLNEAYKCIHYEDDKFFKNTFNYMRSDLLKKYMTENNLALVYQVKQHSYDEDLLHNRKLKFFIVE